MSVLEKALELFEKNSITQAQLDTIIASQSSEPVPIGASTAVVEQAQTETETKVCNKCKDGSKANHAPSCPYKGMTDEGIELAKLKASLANGGVVTPIQGGERVKDFEVPFQKEGTGTWVYGYTTAQTQADKSLPYGKYYLEKGIYAKGSKLKVRYEVI